MPTTYKITPRGGHAVQSARCSAPRTQAVGVQGISSQGRRLLLVYALFRLAFYGRK
jgi:hypothetical protein